MIRGRLRGKRLRKRHVLVEICYVVLVVTWFKSDVIPFSIITTFMLSNKYVIDVK